MSTVVSSEYFHINRTVLQVSKQCQQIFNTRRALQKRTTTLSTTAQQTTRQ